VHDQFGTRGSRDAPAAADAKAVGKRDVQRFCATDGPASPE
jgi:hypothetical protein